MLNFPSESLRRLHIGPRQAAILVIFASAAAEGRPVPTFREIGILSGGVWTGSITRTMAAMRARDLVTSRERIPRSTRLTTAGERLARALLNDPTCDTRVDWEVLDAQ